MSVRGRLPDTWYAFAATLCGVGNAGRMGPFWGTGVALAFVCVTGLVGWRTLAAVTLFGAIVIKKYVSGSDVKDPDEVVLDEAIGFLFAVFGLRLNFVVVAFFLYRIVDTVKPFPARRLLGLPGGLGVLADDVWCGVAVNVILRAAYWLFFAGGLAAIETYFGA
jgi:phosphatidylglycerophosphatase A